MKNLEEQLGSAHSAFISAQDEVGNLLDVLYGDYDNFTHNSYNRSIEVFGVEPSTVAWDALFAAGFLRVWQHPHGQHGDGCDCSPWRPA